MRYKKITQKDTGAVLAQRAGWYASPWSRFHGLMLRKSLPKGEGIVITPCNSVHMAFMRFSIDVVYLDRENRVAKLVHALRPYRVSFGGRKAKAAIELPAGTIESTGLAVGDEVEVSEATPT